jgi:hypothetical protein
LIAEVVVYVALVACGAGLRLVLRDLPNFAPVAAISLFAGFYFRSALLAASLPVTIMVISDYWIGGYPLSMMLLVYGVLTLPVALRSFVRQGFERLRTSKARAIGRVLASSLGASCVFFLATNFGVWLLFDYYDRSFAGLTECFLAAIPFFRYTLAGDLFFSTVLFGSYALAWSVVASPQGTVVDDPSAVDSPSGVSG